MAKTKIEVRERKLDNRYWIVSIDPFFDPNDRKRGFRGKLTTESHYVMGDLKDDEWTYAWDVAKISCSSWCDGTPEEMIIMAEALTIAARYATQMDAEHFAVEKK